MACPGRARGIRLEPTVVHVGAENAGERLDRFLAERLAVSRARCAACSRSAGSSRPAARSRFRTSAPRRAGDEFRILGSLRADEERPEPRPDLALRVVAEGTGWLVVDKPAGCGVHPLRPDEQDTVLNAVVARHPEIIGVGEGGLRSGVVHRLDVDTSGALLLAYVDEAGSGCAAPSAITASRSATSRSWRGASSARDPSS